MVAALVSSGERRYGRLGERPLRVNPLDEWSGLRRQLRRLRLKEWIYFTLIHPELYASTVIQDANYVASSEVYAFLPAEQILHQHDRSGIGGSLRMPERLYDGRARFVAGGYELFYEFGAEQAEHRIELHVAAGRRGAALDASLTLHRAGASAPLSVSSRLPGGLGLPAGPAMYTHKRVFPVSGSFRVGERVLTFDPDRDLAILDEHKSFLPYRTAWTWGTFATGTGDGMLGANLIARPELPGEASENCVWTGNAVSPLSEVTFTACGGPLDGWRVRSAERRVELAFTPAGIKHVKRQLLVAAIDYRQIFGSYSGTVDGRRVDGVHGVIELMNARL